MAFTINKILAINPGAFSPSISTLILENVEKYLLKEYKIPIKLFSVNYKELDPKRASAAAKPGYRYFYIRKAFNQKDK